MEIVAFCCHNALDETRKFEDNSIRVVLLPCSSKIEVAHLISTFEQGVGGVMVIACKRGECQFEDGSALAKGRVSYTGKLLVQIGLEEERIAFFSCSNQKEFFEAAEVMKNRIVAIGPNPLKEKGYA